MLCCVSAMLDTLMFGIRVFHSLYKIGRNGNFVFKGFNNSKKKNLPPVGLDLMLQIITGPKIKSCMNRSLKIPLNSTCLLSSYG